jgi:hypothetical protein
MSAISSLTTDSDRKLRHLMRRGIRTGDLDWTMSAQQIKATSRWLTEAVGSRRLDLHDAIEVANEEFRIAHEHMRPDDPCRYVLVGGEEERVHGTWLGVAGTPRHEITDAACLQLQRLDVEKFRAFHARDPGTRQTADFVVYRLPPRPWKKDAFGMARIRGFPVAHLPRLMAA